MKKKTKKLIALSLTLVCLLGVYFGVDEWKARQEAKESETEEVQTITVTGFQIAEIASYTYENSAYEIGFALTQDGYVNTEDATFPVVESTVESQLAAIAGLEALQVVTGEDKAEYGLNEPQVKITVYLEEGTNRQFHIGDKALFEDAYYVLDVEQNTIYLCESSFMDVFSVEWSDFVAKEEMVKPAADTITMVAIETDGEAVFGIKYEEAMEQPWQITTPDGTFAGDTDAVTTWLGAYSSYLVNKAVTYHCTDFSQYNLEPAATKATIRYTETMEDGTTQERTLVFEFAAEETEDGIFYTRINGSEYVYGVTSYYKSELTEYVLEELLYVEDVEETTETEESTTTEE